MKTAALWDLYHAKHVMKKVMSAVTVENNWSRLKGQFGKLEAEKIGQVHIDDYADERGAAPGTIRKELGTLLALLRWGVKRGHIVKAPDLELPAAGPSRDRWLTEAEITNLLSNAKNDRNLAGISRLQRFLMLALHTAARDEAIRQLTWDQVDFETGVIDFNVPGRRITKKKRSKVPMSKELEAFMLQAYLERTNGLVLGSSSSLYRQLQVTARNAGIKGVSPHVLRHTAATRMARAGVSIWVISKVLGNSVAMVEKVYGHHSPDDLRDAVNLIGGK